MDTPNINFPPPSTIITGVTCAIVTRMTIRYEITHTLIQNSSKVTVDSLQHVAQVGEPDAATGCSCKKAY